MAKPPFSIEHVDNPIAPDYDALASDVAKVLQVTSTPIPVGLFDTNYVMKIDDQRLMHSSVSDHNLTVLTAKQLYERRGIVRNSMRGGKLTVLGTFVIASIGNNQIVTNQVLKSGEGLEYLGYFDTSAAPDDMAPADFRMNGVSAAGAQGKYRIAIIIFDDQNYSKESLDAQFLSFTNSINTVQSVANTALSTANNNASRLTTDEALISALSSALTSAVNRIGTLETRATADEALITALSTSITSLSNRISVLEARRESFGFAAVSLPTLALNATKDVTVTFVQAMPSTAYTPKELPINPIGLTLGNLTFTEKSRTVSSITYTVKNTGLAITAGTFTLFVAVQMT